MLQRMRTMRRFTALCAWLVLLLSLQPTAYADLMTTEEVLAEQRAVLDRASLLASLDRAEVREALVLHGVDPGQARQRVASMTDQEITALNGTIAELPAGSGILGTILLVMIILIFTDLAGWTDVYPRI